MRFAASLDFPDFEQDYEFVSLRHPDEYPINEGRIVSSKGLDIPVSEYEEHFIEEHVAHANALHCVRKGHGAYLVGPARPLQPELRPAAARSPRRRRRAAGLGATCRNPFKSIVVRAVEIVFACDEALRIIDAYEPPDRARGRRRAPRRHRPRRLRGAARDALPPLPHRREGLVAGGQDRPAHLAEPEDDRERPLALRAHRRSTCPKDELTWECEQAIRNYDPCISCATHFLKLDLRRE